MTYLNRSPSGHKRNPHHRGDVGVRGAHIALGDPRAICAVSALSRWVWLGDSLVQGDRLRASYQGAPTA